MNKKQNIKDAELKEEIAKTVEIDEKSKEDEKESTVDKALVKSILIRVAILAAIFLVTFGVGKLIGGLLNKYIAPLAIVAFDFNNIFRLVLMISGLLIVASCFRLLFMYWQPKSKGARTFVSISGSLIHYVIAIVGLVWALAILGVDVKSLIAGAGIVALVIGFGAESLIADIVTGIFMLFDAQFSVGDIIVLGDFRGEVVEIGIRTTRIKDAVGNIKIVNNSDIRNVVNRSANKSVAICEFAVSYDGKVVDKAEQIIDAVIQKVYESPEYHDLFNEAPKRTEGIMSLLPESNLVYLRVTADTDESDVYTVQRLLNRQVFLALERFGISNPVVPVELVKKD